MQRLTREWQPDNSLLSVVRARREHAGEADSEVAHREFAVVVDEQGWLELWCYTPLHAFDKPPDAEVLPGTPRYAAKLVSRVEIPPDTARAAEQLADAQADAASHEATEVLAGREWLALDAEARELAIETRTTARALIEASGQPSRRGRERS